MIVLGIETGGQHGGVAVADGDRLRGEMRFYGVRDYAERLVPWIGSLLDQLDLKEEDLDAVAVSIGPGAFTGIRVGVATAQGLAVALKIPVVPVDSLKVPAFAAGPTDLPIGVVLDAGRGEIYGGVYRWTAGDPEVAIDPELSTPGKFLDRLEPPLHLVGSGLHLVRDQAEKRFGGKIVFPPAGWDGNSPWAVAALGMVLLRERGGVEPQQVKPVYLRPPAARLPE